MIYLLKISFAFYIALVITSNVLAQDRCAVNSSRPFVIDVRDNGAIGDGLTDDTKSLQSAIDQASIVGGKVFVPNGVYLIDAVKGIQVKSDVLMELSKDAVLKAIPNGNTNYGILRVNNAENVVIIGGILLGERYEHYGKLGEWGMGLSFDAATNVVIKNVVSKNNWGDGFYVGGNSKNINFCSVVADGNRRQGMSIVFGSDIFIINSSFINTKGTAPEAGIDLEPNSNQRVSNVKILNSKFISNNGIGIQLYLPPNPLRASISDIEINNNFVANNKKTGVSVNNASIVNIVNNTISSNGGNAIFLDDKTRGGVIRENTINRNGFLNNHNIIDKGINSVSNNLLQ